MDNTLGGTGTPGRSEILCPGAGVGHSRQLSLKRSEIKSKWADYLWNVFNINPIKCTNCGKDMKLAGLVPPGTPAGQ